LKDDISNTKNIFLNQIYLGKVAADSPHIFPMEIYL